MDTMNNAAVGNVTTEAGHVPRRLLAAFARTPIRLLKFHNHYCALVRLSTQVRLVQGLDTHLVPGTPSLFSIGRVSRILVVVMLGIRTGTGSTSWLNVIRGNW